MPKPQPKTRFQLLLDPAQLAALRHVTQVTGASVAEQVRRAIDAWLRRDELDNVLPAGPVYRPPRDWTRIRKTRKKTT
jgi:hypothetical protein